MTSRSYDWRRVGLSALVAVTAAALVGACAGTSTEDTRSSSTVVTDYFGEVEVPAEPVRVVAADPVSLAMMLALDSPPVAASFNPLSLPPHLQESGTDIVNVAGEGGGFDPNIESILAQDPDLVIMVAGYDGEGEQAWNKQTYDRIAASGVPTYGFAYNDGVSIEDVSAGLAHVGDALGLQDRSETLMSELTERMDALRTRVAAAGLAERPVSAVRLSAGGEYSIRVGTGESIAFRGLGMTQPEGQRDPSLFRIDISEENLNVLDSADDLFVYTDTGADAEKAAIEASPLWPTLRAVQNGRVHWVEASVWNASDPIGLNKILDDIKAKFIEPNEQ